MVVLVDGTANGTQAVVAVGHSVGNGELGQSAGTGGLNDAHVGDVVGPRSYFNPSTELKMLSDAYALTLQEKIRDLFFPGLMSRLGDDEFSRRHKAQHDAIKSRMNVDAQYLILDVRNGEYVMEEFDVNKWSIRIKASPLRPEQMRNGLQPEIDGKSYSDTEKKIFIYAEARNGRVKISTIFPGNKWDTIPNGKQALPPASDKNITGI